MLVNLCTQLYICNYRTYCCTIAQLTSFLIFTVSTMFLRIKIEGQIHNNFKVLVWPKINITYIIQFHTHEKIGSGSWIIGT